jgi:hypothetical protein
MAQPFKRRFTLLLMAQFYSLKSNIVQSYLNKTLHQTIVKPYAITMWASFRSQHQHPQSL